MIKDNRVSIDELLDCGSRIYSNKLADYSTLELDEEIELRRNIFIIDQLTAGIFNKNTFVRKDSTASVFQHLFFYLKPKNIEALKYCNIVGSNF